MDKSLQWTDFLEGEIRERLGNCSSRKADILPLAQAKWAVLKNKHGYTKEDALVSILELLDCNSQFFDLTREEYDSIVSSIL